MLKQDVYERRRTTREAAKLERKASAILNFVRNNREMTRDFRVLRCRYAGQLMLRARRMYEEVMPCQSATE